MSFKRDRSVLEQIGVGKYALLDIVSYIEFSFLQADFGRWEGHIFYGNSHVIKGKFNISGTKGSELMEMLTNEFISKRWLKNFFNLTHAQIDAVTHISFSMGIKPENRTGGYEGKLGGEMIYEHDEKIYDIVQHPKLVDDLYVSPRRLHEKLRYFRRKKRRW